VRQVFIDDLETRLGTLESDRLVLLAQLISVGVLDIKILVTKSIGMYHDKFGIIEDKQGDKIVFVGSANASEYAYCQNYEKVRVFRSWVSAESERVLDECNEFETLWQGKSPFVETYDFKSAIQASIVKVIAKKQGVTRESNNLIQLRDYQQEAIRAWVDNAYRGFWVMATGTGKTWTAIYATKKLLEKESTVVVVIAPYKHLVAQWAKDIAKVLDSGVLQVSSDNPFWDKEIRQKVIEHNLGDAKPIWVVSTMDSFATDKFEQSFAKCSLPRLLIVDEAHRWASQAESVLPKYRYQLGLSATPYSGIDNTAGKQLMDCFGGKVYEFGIEKALQQGFLVPYEYHPIFVYCTEAEETQFARLTGQMASCFVGDKLIDKTRFSTLRRARLRVLAGVQQKMDKLPEIVKQLQAKHKHNFVCYCGDGTLFDDQGQEQKHIQFVKEQLNRVGYRPAQFTAKETMRDREDIIERFEQGSLSALAAIRCLDEGVNIPCMEAALLLSSNDNLREFVQRRGRILRTHKGKTSAKIYDMMVMSSTRVPGIAKMELRRFLEYAKLASNWDSLQPTLQEQLVYYDLASEDIAYKMDDLEEIENDRD
ncbi:MAG: DEAD/DEAH box helicase family protein, partial [Firmicutes bacterium]|nr:DEAD/DEAH box helicase family protein [Bacillota bacterium]